VRTSVQTTWDSSGGGGGGWEDTIKTDLGLDLPGSGQDLVAEFCEHGNGIHVP
jgi:hypothetical protein